jgi:hypothetical protein
MPDENTGTTEATADATSTEGMPPAQGEQLGDAGKAALVAERKRAAEAERERNRLAARLKELEDAGKSEVQKLAEQVAAAERARDESAAEALRYKVAAKHGLSVEDLDLLGSGDESVLEVRATRIAALKGNGQQEDGSRPVMPRAPVEALEPGAGRRNTGVPGQLTRSDLKGMSPQAIEEARVAGRLADVLAGKT